MGHQHAAFIFDMDGTLVDNMTFHTQAWQSFLSSLGMEMTEAEVHQKTHGTIEETIRRICGESLLDAEIAALGDRKESIYRALYQPYLQPIAGLMSFLQATQKLGIRMAVGTSAGQRNIDFVLGGLNIAPYFTACVGGDEVRQGKPNPETFLIAADKLDIAPEHCIVFEDTVAGIEAAQNAGMIAVALTTTSPASVFQHLPMVQQITDDYSLLHPTLLLQLI